MTSHGFYHQKKSYQIFKVYLSMFEYDANKKDNEKKE